MFTDINYDEYLSDEIIKFKEQLLSGQITVAELSLPTEKRFASITNRAFEKQPPFLGVDKESDKGFKDALLWESILELKSNKPQSKIIFYSKDNDFCDALTNEFQKLFNDEIFICKNESEVGERLKIWAKAIDEYVHIPEDDSEEEFDFELKLHLPTRLEKKANELAAQYGIISTDDIEKQLAELTGKVAFEDDV